MSAQQVALGDVFCKSFHEIQAGGVRVFEFSYAPDQIIPRHEHVAPYVCFLVGGDFYEENSRNNITYSRARLTYLPKGCAHSGRFGPAGARVIGFELGDAFCGDGVSSHDLPERPEIIADRRIFRMLHAVASGVNDSAVDILTWPYEVTAAIAREHADNGDSWFANVRDYIHAHATENPSPARLGAIANRHPTHVMRVFRRKTGVTIGDYIQAVKIDLACRLIRERELTLTQIASACCFADQSHFIRVFRKAMATSPSAYRRALS